MVHINRILYYVVFYDGHLSLSTTHSCSSVLLLSCVRLLENPWTAACQASLSITNSQSLAKLMSIESVMPSNHLILCCLLLLPSIFPKKFNIQKAKIMASGPITSWQIDGEKNGNSERFYFLGLQNNCGQ